MIVRQTLFKQNDIIFSPNFQLRISRRCIITYALSELDDLREKRKKKKKKIQNNLIPITFHLRLYLKGKVNVNNFKQFAQRLKFDVFSTMQLLSRAIGRRF